MTHLRRRATAPTTHTELHARGAIRGARRARRRRLTTDGGNVACTLGEHSPSLDGFAVGDAVAISCVDGTLTQIERVDAAGGDDSGAGDTSTDASASGQASLLSGIDDRALRREEDGGGRIRTSVG